MRKFMPISSFCLANKLKNTVKTSQTNLSMTSRTSVYLTIFIALLVSCTKAHLSIKTIFDDDIALQPNDRISQMTPEQLGVSRGRCNYNFLARITYQELQKCDIDDHHILHILPVHIIDRVRYLPPLVKCLPWAKKENGKKNEVLIMQTYEEIMELLRPIGNATKLTEAGNCVVVYFYVKSSLPCAFVAPYVNFLPTLFPTLRFAAVDAYKFIRLSADSEIVGVPALLVFHQGKRAGEFYSLWGTFANFISVVTGIQYNNQIFPQLQKDQKGPLPAQPTEDVDYVLILAWGFILICLGYWVITLWR